VIRRAAWLLLALTLSCNPGAERDSGGCPLVGTWRVAGAETDVQPFNIDQFELRLRVVADGPGYHVQSAWENSDPSPPWPGCECSLSALDATPGVCAAEYRYVTYSFDDTECFATISRVTFQGDGAERDRVPVAFASTTYIAGCTGETREPISTTTWAERIE
jgi:hypothetical protein